MNDTAGPLGILIVSHGSPREEANRRFVALVERVASRLGRPHVRAAFLTGAEFSIPRRVAELAEQGVRRIVLMPYFLAAGRHVTEGIPELLEHCRQAHPQVTFEVLPTLEDDPALEDLLVHRLQLHGVSAYAPNS
jgi:sirohydrochlorin cobaltochelatase